MILGMHRLLNGYISVVFFLCGVEERDAKG